MSKYSIQIYYTDCTPQSAYNRANRVNSLKIFNLNNNKIDNCTNCGLNIQKEARDNTMSTFSHNFNPNQEEII
jgi:hypothetical protein